MLNLSIIEIKENEKNILKLFFLNHHILCKKQNICNLKNKIYIN